MTHRDLVARIAALIEEHYIDPGAATRMTAVLRAGRNDHLDEPGLCATLTAELRAAGGDEHVSVATGPAAGQPAGLRERFARDNHGFARVSRLDGDVGRLELTVFSDPAWCGERAVAAMTLLSGARSLIVDLRRNGGGFPAMVALLISYLVEERTLLHTVRSRDPAYGEQSWTLPWVPGPRFPATPVYVLTSARTFSGGEEFAYALQAMGRATVVGETTAGAARPFTVYDLGPAVRLQLPDRRLENPHTGTDWQGVGVVPDVAVPADQALATAHRLTRADA
jgi:C-terminal processing protease CtpA/Prc